MTGELAWNLEWSSCAGYSSQLASHLQSWRQGGRALTVSDGLQARHSRLGLILEHCAPVQPLPSPPVSSRMA